MILRAIGRLCVAVHELQCEKVVGSGSTEIDGGNRNLRLAAICTKRKPRIEPERGAGDRQGASLL
jgi:hypothetical protein